jgi:biotin carboxyl carrier protein
MFQAYINGDKSAITIDQKLQEWFVQGSPINIDVQQDANKDFHVLSNGKSYHIQVLKVDAANKRVQLRINQQNIQVQLKDKFDILLEKMGISSAATTKNNHVYAPMPGKIIQLYAAEVGKTIQAGEPILILEAMKMENVIKATQTATIKSIKTKVGDTVEKKQLLIEME